MALNQVVPLPPLAEQHRIVAKVDELMALCDRMEAARTEREATRDQLATSSLARLNDPDPDPVVFRNQAAFALENLAPLTTRIDQIKALRQTILNLAVHGKLVRQNPSDEPASELLKRIAVEKVERKRRTGDARVKMGFDPKPDDGQWFSRPVGPPSLLRIYFVHRLSWQNTSEDQSRHPAYHREEHSDGISQ